MAVKYKSENGWEDLKEVWVKENDLQWYPCMGDKSDYSWRSSAWGECTAVCGGGFQGRTVECVDANGNVVDDSFCELTIGAKPETSRECNTFACPDCRYGGDGTGINAFTWYQFWVVVGSHREITEVRLWIDNGVTLLNIMNNYRNITQSSADIALVDRIWNETVIYGPDGTRFTRGALYQDEIGWGNPPSTRSTGYGICRNFG